MLKLGKPRILRGTMALLAGCAVIYIGDHLLGIDLELFWGLQTFNLIWFLDLFVVPLLAGIVVGVIFGLGGKWLCYFPPLIVRLFSYYQFMYFTSIPDGASLMPMGWWGFFVILAVESAAFGGVAGEIMVKKTYGRLPRELVYKNKDDRPPTRNSNS
jgi:hypothetical protein